MRKTPADRRTGMEKRGAQRDECDDHAFFKGDTRVSYSLSSPRLRDLYSNGASVNGIRVGQHHVLKCGDWIDEKERLHRMELHHV